MTHSHRYTSLKDWLGICTQALILNLPSFPIGKCCWKLQWSSLLSTEQFHVLKCDLYELRFWKYFLNSTYLYLWLFPVLLLFNSKFSELFSVIVLFYTLSDVFLSAVSLTIVHFCFHGPLAPTERCPANSVWNSEVVLGIMPYILELGVSAALTLYFITHVVNLNVLSALLIQGLDQCQQTCQY